MKQFLTKPYGRRCLSLVMTMLLIVSSVLPVLAEGNKVNYSEEKVINGILNIPQPLYYFDFENASGSNTVANKGSISNANATLVGNYNKIENLTNDEDGHVGVFNNGVGQSGSVTTRGNYLSLPSDLLKQVVNRGTNGMSICFWIKGDVADNCNWSSLFTLQKVGTDTNAQENTWPCLSIYKRGGVYLNAWGLVEASENTKPNYMSITSGTGDGKWHYVSVSITNKSIDYYVDGINYQSSESDVCANIFKNTDDANDEMVDVCTTVSLGGNQLFTWGDSDVCAYFDDFAVYDKALTLAEIQYLYTGIEPTANKVELEAAINSAKLIRTELYTDTSLKVFNQKLSAANTVYGDAAADQTAVDAAKDELVAAQNALVKKSVNLTNGIVLNTDFTTATSVIDSANKIVTSGGYVLTALNSSTVENGYIQLATADGAKQAGVSLDCDVVKNLSVENGFTISARIDTSTATTTDWRDIFNITDSEETLIARYTYGFVTFAGKENVFPEADCKNGFAWDSCKSYQTGVVKTYTLTADSTGVSMYVDGVLACRKTDISLYDFNSVFKNAEHIYIGRAFYDADGDTQGKLHGVTVYNRALNEAEVEALHTTPPSATTVSTDINVMEGSNITVKDGEKTIYTKTVDASKKAVLKGLTPEKEYTYTIELPEGYAVKDGSSIENVPFIAKKDTSDDITIEAVKKAFVLSETTLNLNTKDTGELTLTSAAPEGTTITKAVSSNETVATVQLAEGKVTVIAVSAGTTVVTVTASNGLTAKCQVTVSDVEATEIILSKTETVLEKGKTETITATVKPDNTTDKTVTWTSGNEKIVTVTDGVITAVGAGTAKIVASCGDVTAECLVTVEVPITGIVLDKTELALENKITGDNTIYATAVIKATIQPEDATGNKEITWTSSDEQVVTVKDGNVTAVSDGTAIITATTSNGKTKTCNVTVTSTEIKDLIAAEEITLDKTEGELEEGQTLQLTATITPEEATIKECNWSSSDETIATVNANGLVTAKKAGTATITVTTKDGSELSKKCEITVTPAKIAVTGITLDKISTQVQEGKLVQLVATVTPDNATVKDCEWTSSDETIASVDENGLVTAKQAGKVTITATTKDGSELSAKCEITVISAKVEVTGITLDKTSAETEEGKTVQLVATVTPDNATVKDCEWTSSDETVATVDENGLVTAKQAGTAVITVTSKDNSEISAECTITVTSAAPEKVEVTGITLDKTSAEAEEGKTVQLVATVTPDNATVKDCEWTSSDETVATVDENGLVTAKQAGTAVITVTSKDNSEISAECTITVTSAAPEKVEVTGITLDKTSAEAEEGKTVQLVATVTPDNATVKDCEWTSSDETVATVDVNGLVTAKQAGTAVITVTSKDNPEISAECTITITSVKAPEDGPAIKGEDGKEGWEVIQDYVEKTEEGSVVVVDMKGTTNIQGSVVEQAKKNKVSLVFEISNEIKWTIKAEDITEDKIQDIDLKVTKDTKNIEEAKIKEVAKEKKTTQINLSHNGNFGFTAVLTINLNKENAGKFANLYYFNTAKQILEYMCSDKVDSDGNANLTFQHASDYVIIYDEVAHNINNDDKDNKPDDKDEKPDDKDDKPVNNNPDKNDTDNNKGTTPKTEDSSEAGRFLLVMICAVTALLGTNMEKLGKKKKR